MVVDVHVVFLHRDKRIGKRMQKAVVERPIRLRQPKRPILDVQLGVAFIGEHKYARRDASVKLFADGLAHGCDAVLKIGDELGGAVFNEKNITVSDAPGMGIQGFVPGKVTYLDD